MLKHALGPTRPLLGPCSSPFQIYVNTQSFQVPSVRPDRFWATLNSTLCYCNLAAPRSALTGLTAQHCANYPTFCNSSRLLSFKPPNGSQLTLASHPV